MNSKIENLPQMNPILARRTRKIKIDLLKEQYIYKHIVLFY